MKLDNILGDGIGSIELLSVNGNDKSIVNAARVSFGKDEVNGEFTDKDAKLLKFLLSHEHGSPFEHNQLQFRIKAPLFVHSQWVKHRIGTSINSQSGRYVSVSEQFYIPVSFRSQSKSNRQASTDEPVSNPEQADIEYRNAITQCFAAYDRLLALGVAKEQARGVLAVSQYTNFIFTCNIRSLLHFLHLRNHKDAQWEMQQYARGLKEIAEQYFPYTFAAVATDSDAHTGV